MTDLISEQPSSSGFNKRIPAIAMSGLEKWFGESDRRVHALAPTDLEIFDGEILALLGPSGCGKTTLLRMIGGLLEPSAGKLRVEGRELWEDGRCLTDTLRELGMVFQDANLFPWLTVEKNIALPLELRGISKSERLARARALIRLVGIGGFESNWPKELSGGMRQRAAIARALSYNPKILLMDEPFGALDAMTRDAMNLELQRIWLQTRQTIVIVTHSIVEAVFLANRVVLLSPRPGRIDAVVDVPFQHPRKIDIQSQGEFQRIVQLLRDRLMEIS